MRSVIKVRGQNRIGDDCTPYLIAEIGTNHDRCLETAKQMVHAVADAGFDCAKFQTYEAFEIVSGTVGAKDYGLDKYYGDIPAAEMFDKYLKTPKEWFPELRDLCHQRGIDCATTIHGQHGLEWANTIGFDVIKIASMDHNNQPFLRSLVNAIEAPILVSFGMAALEDIDAAVATLRPHRPGLGVLHCVSIYPPRPTELRLGNLPFLRGRFDVPVGFSDHADDVITSLAALALGACYFEKHVTLDRHSNGPDHPFALEPQGMKDYVDGIRTLTRELASQGYATPATKEENIRKSYLKSVVADRDLAAGTTLRAEDLALQRPGTGIPPKDMDRLIGRSLARAVARGVPLAWDDIGA